MKNKHHYHENCIQKSTKNLTFQKVQSRCELFKDVRFFISFLFKKIIIYLNHKKNLPFKRID